MKNSAKRWLPLLVCGLPGIALSLITTLSIANGGKLFGLSVEWIINCGLRALPFLAGIASFVLFGVFRSKPGDKNVRSQPTGSEILKSVQVSKKERE